MNRLWITAKEASELIGHSPHKLRQAARAGRISAIADPNGFWWFWMPHLTRWKPLANGRPRKTRRKKATPTP